MLQRQGKEFTCKVEPHVSNRRGIIGDMDGACPGPTNIGNVFLKGIQI